VAGLFDRAPALAKRNRRPVDSPYGPVDHASPPHRGVGKAEQLPAFG